jgi:hypothetical protein
MYRFLKFLEWFFRKISLKIQYYVVLNNYLNKIKRFELCNDNHLKSDHSKKMLKEFVRKWSTFKHPFSNEQYKIYSSISGIPSADFVPDNIFYWIIEPTLNRLKTNFAYSNKNFYEKLYTPEFFPRGILHCINNEFYDSDYHLIKSLNQDIIENLLTDYNQVILKPALETSSGRNVKLFVRNNAIFTNGKGEELSADYLNKIKKSDFILQEKVKSHPFYAQFNYSSLNTVRLMTYRSVKTDKIDIVSGMLRIGEPGSVVDNRCAGGAAVGLSRSGKINSRGINGNCNIIKHLPANPDIRFDEIGVAFNYDLMVNAARKVSSQILNFRLISYDLCIDSEDSPRIIEINLGNQGTTSLQALNGPLFGEYTDEIIEYSLKNKKIRNHVLL